MRTLIIPLQLLALAGLALSIAAHVASLLQVALPPPVMILHVGIFAVYAPAIFFSRAKFQHLRGLRRWSMNPLTTWSDFFEGCPSWMGYITGALFIYAFANFFWCVNRLPQHQLNTPENFSQTVRMFSGHWMIFYWAAFALLYSAQHAKPPTTCAGCGKELLADDQYCPQCGQRVAARSSGA